MSDSTPMTKGERNELAKVARLRARVAGANVAQRQAELLAEIEEQLSAEYRFDDAAWADVTTEANRAIAEADAAVSQRCRDLGIPDRFRPSLTIGWYSRGENAAAARRTELRALAKARVEADAKAAKLVIANREADVLTEIIAGGLETDAARRFLDSIPTAHELMPAFTLAELQPVAPANRSRIGGLT